jgi:DNA-binding NarL/FixJ family response regulator
VGKIRVVVIDDHQLVLDAVGAVVQSDGDFEIVGTALSGRDLVSLVGRTQPDVVVLDLCIPGPDGIACLEILRNQWPRTKVIVLSGVDEPRLARQALSLGASAFVRKDIDPRDLVSVLRQTVEETVVSQLASVQEVEDEVRATKAVLTKAELAVLDGLSRGHVNKQIATDLAVAQQTVKFHLTNIYRKLGVGNRTEAIRYAYEHGLVEEPTLAHA